MVKVSVRRRLRANFIDVYLNFRPVDALRGGDKGNST